MVQTILGSAAWKRRFRESSSDRTVIGEIPPSHTSLDAASSLGMLGGSLSLLA